DHLAEDFARVGVADFGSGRHGKVDVLRRLAAHVLALPVLPAFRYPVRVIPVIQKSSEIVVDSDIDAAAFAPIASVGPAFGDKLFATEGGRAGAAGAGGDLHDDSVYEHPRLRPPPVRRAGVTLYS